MSEIVDRVKQAFRRQFETELSDGNVGAEELARAAIEAIREPLKYVLLTPEGDRIHALLRPARIEACRQTDCCRRGFDEANCGKCATCADIADFVGEAYWRAMIDAALRD